MIPALKVRKKLDRVIVQGNQHEIQNLFTDIVQLHTEEFRECNITTIADFLVENLVHAVNIHVESLMREYPQTNPQLMEHVARAMISTIEHEVPGSASLPKPSSSESHPSKMQFVAGAV